MTEKEINQLAEKISEILIARQAEYDKQFVDAVLNIEEIEGADMSFMTKYIKTDPDMIALHLDRLEALLEFYISTEQYEEADKVKKEIDEIQNKLK